MKLAFLLTILCTLHLGSTVDPYDFKKCDQSSFCRRCRKVAPGNSPYSLVPGTLNTYSDSVTSDIVNNENGHLFVMKLEGLQGNTFRLLIDEKTPLKPRYRVTDALKGNPVPGNIKVTEEASQLVVTLGKSKAVISATPFKIDFYQNEKLSLSVNAKGLMRFEHLRKKPGPPAGDAQNAENQEAPQEVAPKSIEDEDPGSWRENFKSHFDTKPNGPEAVALDFTFPQADVLFGIPEHAESFALKPTSGTDPYRLYNLDVFEYELDSKMALYGAVPVIYGHGPEQTIGVYWQNPSETWIDIYNSNAEKNVVSSIVNFVSGSRQTEPPAAHFMSESGIVDVFVLLGPSPLDAFKQYTDLTGTAPLPQLFALAYHQSRWNYNDDQDVNSVSNKFDEHDIPMDIMWLDIEYTDGKKYFTWDPHKFAHSLDMIHNLTSLGRHLVVIIDPHIKREGGYFFHQDCTDRGYYTKNKEGNDYQAWCWPGLASYPDLFNPEVRKYFADQYLVENFKGSTKDVMIWNDMNEPSVFNGPELTMPKDNLHFGGWEHRHVHNLYGHEQLIATFDGLSRRDPTQRPFILSRSHFSGSQRYAAIWTGNNKAEWDHLPATIKMCLSESVAGYSFCGADVGGFYGSPDAELLTRWYQAGAFQPFMRSHADIDTKRREPWLFPEDTKQTIRSTLRKRYSYLPFWYTMFYEHERDGLPVMRPLLAHYPKDKEAFAVDSEYLLQDRMLVSPVMKQGADKVDVYFPVKENNKGDIWYDVDDYRRITTAGYETIPADINKIPVYQRGGTIIPKKERIRRASTLMRDDPYTLIICLDEHQSAKGTLYIDDEKSYEYRKGQYLYIEYEFKNGVFRNRFIDEKSKYTPRSWLDRIVIVGLEKKPKTAKLQASKTASADLVVLEQGNTLIVRNPGVGMTEDITITLNFLSLEDEAKRIGLRVNETKTKFMTQTRKKTPVRQNMTMEDHNFESVENFVYLGANLNKRGAEKDEIERRINAANRAYYSVLPILRSRDVHRKNKLRIYKSFVKPVLLYGCETWTFTSDSEKAVDVFERKVLRKIYGPVKQGAEWRLRYNDELYELFDEPPVSTCVKLRKLQWAGHLERMEDNRLPKRTLKGRAQGRRPAGRPRTRWEDTIEADSRSLLGVINWRTRSQNRDDWRSLILEAKARLGLSRHR